VVNVTKLLRLNERNQSLTTAIKQSKKYSLFKSIEEKVNKPLTEQVLIFSLSCDLLTKKWDLGQLIHSNSAALSLYLSDKDSSRPALGNCHFVLSEANFG